MSTALHYVVVIPARFASSRLPGKPLIEVGGKTILRRTWEKCVEAVPAEFVYVATDSPEIEAHCRDSGMQVVMTSTCCLTGTDRIAEFAERIEADTYVNVQGDEPLISPDDIRAVVEAASRHPDDIINGFVEIESAEQYASPSIPKVVVRPDGRLLYMSRSPIPGNKARTFHWGWRQICVYAFPRDALRQFSAAGAKTPLEEEEDIEILRFLELGREVRMIPLSNASVALDTPEDLVRIRRIIEHDAAKPEAIFWDFDGVLMDSNAVRDRGFEAVLADHPREQVEKLLAFHRANGGLSRYVKFRYFLEEVCGEAATEDRIQAMAAAFSEYMRKALVNPRMLIEENMALVRRYSRAIPMYVVSGSDQVELRYLCREMKIDGCFASIHGSPVPKTELVAAILREFAYDPGRCVLVGDSYNDRDAAQTNGVAFSGYGNPDPKFPVEVESIRALRDS